MSEDIKEWAHMWGAKVRLVIEFFSSSFQLMVFCLLGEIKK
jgi:hypothetical protein